MWRKYSPSPKHSSISSQIFLVFFTVTPICLILIKEINLEGCTLQAQREDAPSFRRCFLGVWVRRLVNFPQPGGPSWRELVGGGPLIGCLLFSWRIWKMLMDGWEAQLSFSKITCPECGHQKREKIPTSYCETLYECEGCGATLTPEPKDCCVFCSYGSVPCPRIHGHFDQAD